MIVPLPTSSIATGTFAVNLPAILVAADQANVPRFNAALSTTSSPPPSASMVSVPPYTVPAEDGKVME